MSSSRLGLWLRAAYRVAGSVLCTAGCWLLVPVLGPRSSILGVEFGVCGIQAPARWESAAKNSCLVLLTRRSTQYTVPFSDSAVCSPEYCICTTFTHTQRKVCRSIPHVEPIDSPHVDHSLRRVTVRLQLQAAVAVAVAVASSDLDHGPWSNPFVTSNSKVETAHDTDTEPSTIANRRGSHASRQSVRKWRSGARASGRRIERSSSLHPTRVARVQRIELWHRGQASIALLDSSSTTDHNYCHRLQQQPYATCVVSGTGPRRSNAVFLSSRMIWHRESDIMTLRDVWVL